MELALGTRRVQDINGCYFVSLPRIWARTRGLEKGDRVHIDLLDDGSLKISRVGADGA